MTKNRLEHMPTHALALLYRKTMKKVKDLYSDLSPDNIDEAIDMATKCKIYKDILKKKKKRKRK